VGKRSIGPRDRRITHWSIRKLADYLNTNPARPVTIGRERLRQLLHHHGVSFQRTRTWKESADPDKDAKLDRIEEVTRRPPIEPHFGPLHSFAIGNNDPPNHPTRLCRNFGGD
jgi:hypothetical protein